MTLTKLLSYLPRGNLLDDATWRRRHKFLLGVLTLHLPAVFGLGLILGQSVLVTLIVTAPLALCSLLGAGIRQRRAASFFVTAGLVYSAAAFTVLSRGSIEAHFHFFVIIGLIALYQDWVPFMWNIVFTVLSHGLGSLWRADLIFNHPAGQISPWTWSLLHGSAVLAACIGVVVFWRETEDQQQKTLSLTTQLAETEINQRKFTSELLVNLARRNQSMLYRQLDIINQLEEKERDPDALGELFRLDHLATRIRRNAESLLVLSGEEPTRVWGEPVRLIDVVRAAIAETEDLDRVAFAVDERMEVLGHTVSDLTHLLAELTENAVRFSPPEANVTIRTRPYLRMPGAAVLTVEDWGVGMRPEDMAAANDLLTHPQDVDLSVSQRLGLHVVARLAARHNIQISLTPTPGTGVTAVVVLSAELFATNPQQLAPEKVMATAPGPRGADSAVAGPMAPPSLGAPSHLGSPVGPGAPLAPAAPVPDIPVPRGGGNGSRPPAAQPNGNGSRPPAARPNGNGSRPPAAQPNSNGSRPNGNPDRGLHARPEPEESPDWKPKQQAETEEENPDWLGWWTPHRPPTGQASPWETGPIYATAEPLRPEPPRSEPPPTPAAVVTPPAALPPAPSRAPDLPRPTDPAESGPTIIARTARGAGATDSAGSEKSVSLVGDSSDPALGPVLTRRVPQANLAPELRRSRSAPGGAVPEPAPPPDAEQARDALSRFQASRQAAQQQVGSGEGSTSSTSSRNGRES